MGYGKYGFDPETGYPLCRRGHVKSPDNINKRKECKKCKQIYKQTEKYKTYNREYNREYKREYRKTEKYKEARKIYRATEKAKAANMEYGRSEKRKAYEKAYARSEGCKAARAAYEKTEKRKAQKKTRRDNLVGHYIAARLGIPTALATPELLEIKRLTIQLRRTLKCQNQQTPLQQAA